MLRFLSRRILFVILVCVFIVFSVNLGMRMIHNSELPEPDFGMVLHTRNAWQDTTNFFSDLYKGDIGSIEQDVGQTVLTIQISDFLSESFINSMGLLLVTLAGSSILALYIGGVIALTKRQYLVLPLLTITILGISTPSFFGGLLLQQFELNYQARFGHRLVSVAGFGWDYKHMLLPVLVLSARPIAYISRATFMALSTVMKEDYIRTAYSKGIRQRWVLFIHAFRNMSIPVLTAVGVSLRFSLSTLPIVEYFFAWPGMGFRLIQAINERQSVVVVALAFVMGLTFQIFYLILDIIFRIIDPRLRETV